MELERLTTEARNPASEQIDRLSALEIVRLMNAEDTTVAGAVGRVAASIAAAIEVIADRLRDGGRLVYVGAGTSGRLGVLDASECPPTFNTQPWQVVGLIAGGSQALTRAIEGAEDSADAAVADLQRIALGERDVLVGIATSGRTPYVLAALRYANQVGAYSIGLSCNADSQLSELARLNIVPVVGPEVISGSTRLKAGTATKLVLNMLTTGAMVRLGKTYGNLMVDLQATNQKLAERSRRLIMLLGGATAGEAAERLRASGGDLKAAIVAHRRSLSAEQARGLLLAAGGRLRVALELPLDEAPQQPAKHEPQAAEHLELVLGVDGGGTKTLARLAYRHSEPGEILGQGLAGCSNPQLVGWKTACENLQCAIQRAFRAADLAPGPAWSACLAVAGAGRPEDQRQLRQWGEENRLAVQLSIVHDAAAVLAAASPEAVGVALISGTGSIAFGRDAGGRTARSGGWGNLFGEEGSGAAIAREALQAVARALDGRGPQTQLVNRVLEAFQARSPQELLRAVYRRQAEAGDLASLSKSVAAAAEAGDAVARDILLRAARELSALYAAVARQLDRGSPASAFRLALAGGVLLYGPLREELIRQVSAMPEAPAAIQFVAEPVIGALQIARLAPQLDWVARD